MKSTVGEYGGWCKRCGELFRYISEQRKQVSSCKKCNKQPRVKYAEE